MQDLIAEAAAENVHAEPILPLVRLRVSNFMSVSHPFLLGEFGIRNLCELKKLGLFTCEAGSQHYTVVVYWWNKRLLFWLLYCS